MPGKAAREPTKQADRVFPNGLILVGLALAISFWLTLRFGEALLGPGPEIIPFQLEKITPAQSYSQPTCQALNDPSHPHNETRFRAAPGSKPDIFEIILTDWSAPAVLVLDNNPDQVRLLSCVSTGLDGSVLQAGARVAQSDKPLLSTLTALPIKSTDDPTVRHLIWINTVAAVPFGLSVMPEADFQTYSATKLKVHIGFISAIALMIIYNLALALSSQIPAFLFNALSILCVLLLDLYRTGVGMSYLWPEHAHISPYVLIAALAGASMFSPFYTYRFIVPIDQGLLQAKPWILIWPVLAVLAVASLVFLHPIWVTLLVLVLFNLLSVVVTVHLLLSAYRRHEPAAVFLVVSIGVVVPSLIAGGARELAGVDFGPLGAHLIELGLLFEAPAFTLVLAYQILLSRKREVEAVKALNRHAKASKRNLLDALDAERTRLASDLHDSGGQMLGLVLSRLRGLAQGKQNSKALRSDIDEVAGLAREALDELRRVTQDLHPATLTHLGLKRAIAAMCKEITKAGHLRVHCKQDFDEAALTTTESLQIYRIFQEVAANASRHSGASDATLELSSRGGTFTLRFSDNGTGSVGSTQATGLGREILLQRVERLGGVQQTSTGEFGTTMTITFKANREN